MKARRQPTPAGPRLPPLQRLAAERLVDSLGGPRAVGTTLKLAGGFLAELGEAFDRFEALPSKEQTLGAPPSVTVTGPAELVALNAPRKGTR